MGLGFALGSIGSSVVSGALGYLGSHSANQAMMAMSREQMEWQERMANTAHQREVKDLRAAGLNPILSATGGNGAPTGTYQTPTLQNEFGDFGNEINKGVNSALTALQTESNINKQNEEIHNLKVMNDNINSATNKLIAETALTNKDLEWKDRLYEAQLKSIAAGTILSNANTAYTITQDKLQNVIRGKEEVTGGLWHKIGDGINSLFDWLSSPNTAIKGASNSGNSAEDVGNSFKEWNKAKNLRDLREKARNAK